MFPHVLRLLRKSLKSEERSEKLLQIPESALFRAACPGLAPITAADLRRLLRLKDCDPNRVTVTIEPPGPYEPGTEVVVTARDRFQNSSCEMVRLEVDGTTATWVATILPSARATTRSCGPPMTPGPSALRFNKLRNDGDDGI